VSKGKTMSGVKASGDYKETRTYRNANAETKKLISRYRKENVIGDEQAFLLLYLNDLKHEITQDEKKKANGPGETMVVLAIICDLIAVSSGQPIPIFICTGLLLLMTILYLTGRFNSYETEKRRVRKLLKQKFDEKPEFDKWTASQNSDALSGGKDK
jgi:hypothetical protein